MTHIQYVLNKWGEPRELRAGAVTSHLSDSHSPNPRTRAFLLIVLDPTSSVMPLAAFSCQSRRLSAFPDNTSLGSWQPERVAPSREEVQTKQAVAGGQGGGDSPCCCGYIGWSEVKASLGDS